MIKKFSDYDSIQVFEGGSALEPGGYECKIIGAKVEKFTNWEGPPYKGGNSCAKTKWHEKPFWRRKSFKY